MSTWVLSTRIWGPRSSAIFRSWACEVTSRATERFDCLSSAVLKSLWARGCSVREALFRKLNSIGYSTWVEWMNSSVVVAVSWSIFFFWVRRWTMEVRVQMEWSSIPFCNRVLRPPCSRSTRTTASETWSPASKRGSAVSRMLLPEVMTSSTMRQRWPGAKSPSMSFPVP